jgi:hypothetical protein
MRAYQAFHLDSRGWCDFAYSSGVCPHGTRYVGRGPGVRTAAQGTNDGNLRSYACVGLWGDGDPLTDPAKLAYLDEGARLARLRWGHRDWKSTACPGNPAYAWRSAGFPRPSTPPPEDDMPLNDTDLAKIGKLIDDKLDAKAEDFKGWARLGVNAAARQPHTEDGRTLGGRLDDIDNAIAAD